MNIFMLTYLRHHNPYLRLDNDKEFIAGRKRKRSSMEVRRVMKFDKVASELWFCVLKTPIQVCPAQAAI